tara:strand:- start:234 stop:749 length:516 start_codon:yes stop_codon:yes gene_type:complete
MASILKVNTIQDATNSTTAMTVDTAGRILTPARPIFSCSASGQSNLANGATTTVTWTEITDIGNNFASNTFTAPVGGHYQLNVNIDFRQLSNNTNSLYNVYLVTTNRTYQHSTSGFDSDTQNRFQSVSICHVCDMDASETAIVQVLAENQDTGHHLLDVGSNSRFSGFLVG